MRSLGMHLEQCSRHVRYNIIDVWQMICEQGLYLQWEPCHKQTTPTCVKDEYQHIKSIIGLPNGEIQDLLNYRRYGYHLEQIHQHTQVPMDEMLKLYRHYELTELPDSLIGMGVIVKIKNGKEILCMRTDEALLGYKLTDGNISRVRD